MVKKIKKGDACGTTSIKNFEFFKESAKSYIDTFGLKDWEVSFYHKDASEYDLDGDGTLSFVIYSKDGSRTANICLNPNWGDEKITSRRLKQCAFHEVVHLLLAPLTTLAVKRHIAQGVIEEEEHGLIRILENTLFGDE